MINQEVEKLIQENQEKNGFIYPNYDKYCFSNIPSTILSFFNIKTKKTPLPPELHKSKIEIENINKVVLFLIDGMGYNQWLKYKDENHLFEIFSNKGLVSPITSVFPSTTASAMNTINSGLTPQEHGLPEWRIYFREIDMILKTLPFSPLDPKFEKEFKEKKPDPKILFNKKTIYQELKRHGIKTIRFVNGRYHKSEYSKIASKGSEIIPFINSSDLSVNLRKKLEDENGPTYFFVYYDSLDSMQHKYGPNTEENNAEYSSISYSIKRNLIDKISKKSAKETLFIFSADHGQINIEPKKTIYLNKYKTIKENFQKGKKNIILPTGGPRDVFLHIKNDKLDDVEEFILKKLGKKANILRTKELLNEGLFGRGKVHEKFLDRIGNLLILPKKNSTIWYEHYKGKRVEHKGHHGGLTKQEMLVPFSITKLSDLI